MAQAKRRLQALTRSLAEDPLTEGPDRGGNGSRKRKRWPGAKRNINFLFLEAETTSMYINTLVTSRVPGGFQKKNIYKDPRNWR